MRSETILLVNPWVADFAAYDLWSKPLGLLCIGKFLRRFGYEIALLDLMDRQRWGQTDPGSRDDGRGKYPKTVIPKPEPLAHVPRKFGIYGAVEEDFRRALQDFSDVEVVLLTSHMTYWYPGVERTARIIRELLPGAKIILGGIYASLCPDHARQAVAPDMLIGGYGEKKALCLIDEHYGKQRDYSRIPEYDDSGILPWDLYTNLQSVALLTSRGCPYACSYCATRLLNPVFRQRSPEDVMHEILETQRQFGVRDFAFYDDALFIHKQKHILPILREIIAADVGIRFHTPNGLFAREIYRELAELMYQAGIRTVRLSLESSVARWQKASSQKTDNDDFSAAIRHLKVAGYRSSELEVYLIFGLPGQTFDEVAQSIRFVHSAGAIARLASFSPIPGTVQWQLALERGCVYEDMDPLLTNNSPFPCVGQGLTMQEIEEIKQLARTMNENIRQGDRHGKD